MLFSLYRPTNGVSGRFLHNSLISLLYLASFLTFSLIFGGITLKSFGAQLAYDFSALLLIVVFLKSGRSGFILSPVLGLVLSSTTPNCSIVLFQISLPIKRCAIFSLVR